MKTLQTLLEDLPPELFDEIYSLTFTTTSTITCIDKDYKPPNILQVSRRTREALAESYHGKDSIFYVDKKDIEKWVTSIPWDHVCLLDDVRVQGLEYKQRGASWEWAKWVVYTRIAELYDSLSENVRERLPPSVVKFKGTLEPRKGLDEDGPYGERWLS